MKTPHLFYNSLCPFVSISLFKLSDFKCIGTIPCFALRADTIPPPPLFLDFSFFLILAPLLKTKTLSNPAGQA